MILNRAVDFESCKLKLRLQVELQTEFLYVFNVVLDVLAYNELQVVAHLLRQRISGTSDFNVGLSLLGALNCDEIRAALLVIGAFLLDLITKTFLGGKGRNRQLVDLVNLHWRHVVELFRAV